MRQETPTSRAAPSGAPQVEVRLLSLGSFPFPSLPPLDGQSPSISVSICLSLVGATGSPRVYVNFGPSPVSGCFSVLLLELPVCGDLAGNHISSNGIKAFFFFFLGF